MKQGSTKPYSLFVPHLAGRARGHPAWSIPAGVAAAEALTRMLDRTGLRFEVVNSRIIRVLRITTVAEAPPAANPAAGQRPLHPRTEPLAQTLDDILLPSKIGRGIWMRAAGNHRAGR